MTKEKKIQLIKAMSSIGYEVAKFDCTYDCKPEIIIIPASKKKFDANNEMIKLIETLFSIGFEITIYEKENIYKSARRDIRIELHPAQ